MADDIDIIEVTESELPDLLNLYALPEFDNGEKLKLSDAQTILKRISAYPDYKIYLAKKNGMAIGTFSLIIIDNVIHLGKPSALVEAVIVHPDFRSSGAGKTMMLFAMEKCRQANCTKLSLSSRSFRVRAHEFYERLGFKKHGFSFFIELH